MSKRLIGVCIVIMLIFSICGCAQTAEDRFVAEPEIVEIEIAETDEEMFSPESTPVPEPMPTTEAVLEEEQKD